MRIWTGFFWLRIGIQWQVLLNTVINLQVS
jgi:hypothetical protein